jgi:hypothetical protein
VAIWLFKSTRNVTRDEGCRGRLYGIHQVFEGRRNEFRKTAIPIDQKSLVSSLEIDVPFDVPDD